MEKNPDPKYYEDLVVTTTFSVDHPNYIGRHLRFRRIGNNFLILCIIGIVFAAFYYPSDWLIIGIPVALVIILLVIKGERTIKDINSDLLSEPVDVEGVVKEEKESQYPRGFVYLEGQKDIFRTDITFVRRIQKGQKVRFICTPRLKYVKAWQRIN